MRVRVHWTSDWNYEEIKEFQTEKEMLDYGLIGRREPIIINKDYEHDGQKYDYDVEIYDDYRE